MLNDVTLSFHGNQLVVIAGAVGSGKSSLLTAILGELCATRGQVFHDGELAYAPQKPWLFSGTVSQNILFGKTMNQTRYRETVDACALEADFDLLPDGDNTFIGERGVSLSGGQQSRINLARAVYSGADIYLLDDPLSAVDARVGRHIFERCILGRLSDTLRILVTHRVEYFQHADCIVVLQNGRVRCQGKYEELLTSDEYFAELVQNKKAASEEDENKKGPAVASVASAEAEPPSESEGFHTVEEDREVGSVTGHTYWTYVKAAMPIPCAVVAAVLIFLPDGKLDQRRKRDGRVPVAIPPPKAFVSIHFPSHENVSPFSCISRTFLFAPSKRRRTKKEWVRIMYRQGFCVVVVVVFLRKTSTIFMLFIEILNFELKLNFSDWKSSKCQRIEWSDMGSAFPRTDPGTFCCSWFMPSNW